MKTPRMSYKVGSHKEKWKREVNIGIKRGYGFEQISDHTLSVYPEIDNQEGREKLEKYYNQKYPKSKTKAGWF